MRTRSQFFEQTGRSSAICNPPTTTFIRLSARLGGSRRSQDRIDLLPCDCSLLFQRHVDRYTLVKGAIASSVAEWRHMQASWTKQSRMPSSTHLSAPTDGGSKECGKHTGCAPSNCERGQGGGQLGANRMRSRIDKAKRRPQRSMSAGPLRRSASASLWLLGFMRLSRALLKASSKRRSCMLNIGHQPCMKYTQVVSNNAGPDRVRVGYIN
jgi:hypothetical protein